MQDEPPWGISRMAGDITRLLAAWRDGDAGAPNRLFSLVYDELRALAHHQLRRAHGGMSMDTTGLVHEAYVKLVGGSEVSLHDREHFFALAATAMRQILVDYARRQKALKRGGRTGRGRTVRLEDAEVLVPDRATEVLAVHEALTKLEKLEPRLGKVVELRVFGGLAVEEVASLLAVSERTIKRDWNKARAFLYLELGGTGTR